MTELTGDSRLVGLRLDEFLDALAAEGAIPAGGAAAAVCAAMANSLVAMAARTSPDWQDAAGVAAQAQALRARVVPLALADSDAYAEALDALRLPPDPADPERGSVLAAALGRACDLPLEIAEAAADTAELAAYAAEHCAVTVRGEVLVAAALAEAAVRAAVRLVEINLATTDGDPRLRRAQSVARAAAEALHRTGDDS